MPSLCVLLCVWGTPCIGTVRTFVLSGTVHVPFWYLLKWCVEHMTVRMWVHYTSGIASYKALQKGSFKKPCYCLNVQSHVSYFANVICQICLFCRLHPLHHPLHSCPCPPNSVSSFFLLCFILAPLSPSHFWWVFNCSFVIAGNLVQLLFHHDEFGDCFLYCRCITSILYVYGLPGTVVSVHVVFSTVRIMVGVSLPYCVHVLLQPVHGAWYGSFRAPSLQYSSTVLTISLVRH